jgi:hypothetical protein
MTLSDGESDDDHAGKAGIGDDDEESEEEEEEEEEEEMAETQAETQGTAVADTPEGDKKLPAKRRRGRPPGKGNKKGTKPKASLSKKRAKFLEIEDINLCKAWLNTSQSPITGTNQSGPNFWSKIKDAYDAYMNKIPLDADEDPFMERTQQSLLDRFQRVIKKDVNYFNGFFIQRKKLNESGKNDQDRIIDAMEDYKLKTDGKSFKFQHCLEVLWLSPQFSVSGDFTTPTSRPPSRASRNSASSPVDDFLQDNESAALASDIFVRFTL